MCTLGEVRTGGKWGRDSIGRRRLLADGARTPRSSRRSSSYSPKEQSCQLPISCARSRAKGMSACKLSSKSSSPCDVPRSRAGCDARDGGGGPDENVDHAEALEEHALVERQIAALRQTLARVEVINYNADGTAGMGAYVCVGMPHGVVMRCQLAGTSEAEPRRCRIWIRSPVGQVILGRREGDVVDVDAPGGATRIEILEIEPPTDALAA